MKNLYLINYLKHLDMKGKSGKVLLVKAALSFLLIAAFNNFTVAQCTIKAVITNQKNISCSDPTNGGVVRIKVTQYQGLGVSIATNFGLKFEAKNYGFDSVIITATKLAATTYTITLGDPAVNNCEVSLSTTITKTGNMIERFSADKVKDETCSSLDGAALTSSFAGLNATSIRARDSFGTMTLKP